jgi:hypothetical protein
MLIKTLNLIFFVAFALSVLVQFNDPDPVAWIVVYSAAALLCIMQFLDKVPVLFPVTLLVTAIIWIGLLLPSVMHGVPWADIFDSLTMKTKSVEEAREIGGLALIAFWAAVILGIRLKAKGHENSH